jgi:hypothetical protein
VPGVAHALEARRATRIDDYTDVVGTRWPLTVCGETKQIVAWQK